MAKYQKLFLEEAAEHLSEIGHALLELEKDTSGAEPIDTIFRMAHSIKSMAASLGYDSVSELSHVLEDRMETIRSAGRVSSGAELSLLFQGLEGLERMVESVRETGDPPGRDTTLLAALSGPPEDTDGVTIDPSRFVESGCNRALVAPDGGAEAESVATAVSEPKKKLPS